MGFDWLAPKNYKRHYICLDCQKGFKRPSKKDMKHDISEDFSNLMNEYYESEIQQDIVQYIINAYQKIKVTCPNCQSEMIQVHYNFEVPPLRDNKSWKKLRETLSGKMKINYATYMEWHRLELKKVEKNSTKYKILQQNIEKLKKEPLISRMKQSLFYFILIYLALFNSCTVSSTNNNDVPIESSNNHDNIVIKSQIDTTSQLKFTSGIRSIFEDSKGNLWFGSHQEGVCLYDGEKIHLLYCFIMV